MSNSTQNFENVSNLIRDNLNQKSEFFKMIKLFNHNLKKADKEQYNFLKSYKADQAYSSLYEIYLTYEMNLKNKKFKEVERIQKLSQMVKKFKNESITVDKFEVKEFNLDQLEKIMEKIDALITKYKEEYYLTSQSLNNEEKNLLKEIDIYEKKITSWQTINNQDNSVPNSSKVSIKLAEKSFCNKSKLIKEVIEFDKFCLTNGGHSGGWEEIDHNLFIKIRNKYKGQNEFLNDLENLLATKTRQQLEQHEQWFQKYSYLKTKKRDALNKWKNQKLTSKNETVNLVDEEIKLNQEIEKELKNRLKKKKLIEKEARLKKLNEWKLNKELQKTVEAELKRKEDDRKFASDEKEKIRKEELRQKVFETKRQKEELNEYLKMEQEIFIENEKQLKQKIIRQEIVSFQQRDSEFMNQKFNKLKAKEQDKIEKEKRLEKLKEKFDFESSLNQKPSRIHEMTSNWKTRVTTPRSESFSNTTLIPRNMPHLAVPSWRQGL